MTASLALIIGAILCSIPGGSKLLPVGQWCGSVGRAVASDNSGLRFKCSSIEHLFTVSGIEKT